ncbi:flagellar motor protein MotB [Alphaproteobacteria bacterium]|nr:flagellar motor protein MotB [Alphaproteobacteria bacterium]|tara:strand:- start:910 stop:1569 length:660 start_codon:yes stop_codon:yes gene_type:complete
MPQLPPPPPQEEEKEDWLLTYADAITLLMAFFVLLYTVSDPNTEKFEAVTKGMVESLKGGSVKTPFTDLSKDLSQVQSESEASKVGSTKRGLTFEFKSRKMFLPGSAEIVPEGIKSLDRVAQVVTFRLGKKNYTIEIEGHTDDSPISSTKFPSNWELSSARASAVVRFMISRGIPPNRLRAVGYADTKPKEGFPFKDKDGNPLPENKEEGRRVVIRIER